MREFEPWSPLGGLLLVVGAIALPCTIFLLWWELTKVTRALWALVSQLKAARGKHGGSESGVLNSMFGR